MAEIKKVNVFENEKIVNIGGNELKIRLASFVEGERLFTETLKCYKEGLFDVNLLQKEEFKTALLPCLAKAFWNNEPIRDLSFFEAPEKRQYYIEICLEVFDFNIQPFTNRLLSQSQRASQETDSATRQK